MEQIVIKLTKIKNKEKNIKSHNRKAINNIEKKKQKPIRIPADLSAETLQARREWQDIFKVMKRRNLAPRTLHPARLSFRFHGEIKSFSDKQKLKEFSSSKPALQQLLKEFL